VQASRLVTGQIDHDGDGPIDSDPRRSPDVLIDTECLHVLQPGRVGDAGFGFNLDGVPGRVPVHPEMAGQRRDGGVVIAERIDRPAHRPDGERRPRRRQIMGLAERSGRTGRFSAAPDPHQPADQRDPAKAWSIVQYPDSAAVTDSHHPAAWAGRLHLAGLDGEHQASLVVDLHVEDMHVRNIEDPIGLGAPARTQAAHRVRHRRGFRSKCLVASDPQAPTPSSPDQHAQRGTAPPMLRSEEPV